MVALRDAVAGTPGPGGSVFDPSALNGMTIELAQYLVGDPLVGSAPAPSPCTYYAEVGDYTFLDGNTYTIVMFAYVFRTPKTFGLFSTLLPGSTSTLGPFAYVFMNAYGSGPDEGWGMDPGGAPDAILSYLELTTCYGQSGTIRLGDTRQAAITADFEFIP